MITLSSYTATENMNKECGKSLRPVRSRRYARRSFIIGNRPPKRLFTPEIKRYLKDWLVRRRENPYPNREEKKYLAQETGLTYIQICNWFANWRRKLKNVSADRIQKTWGHLIRTYNDQAQGNVEQFSICSDDSIWSEHETSNQHFIFESESSDRSGQHVSPVHDAFSEDETTFKIINNNTYETNPNIEQSDNNKDASSPLLLSKWLASAARFQPSENNYSLWGEDLRRSKDLKCSKAILTSERHGRDEVEAAVALTALATAAGRIVAP